MQNSNIGLVARNTMDQFDLRCTSIYVYNLVLTSINCINQCKETLNNNNNLNGHSKGNEIHL